MLSYAEASELEKQLEAEVEWLKQVVAPRRTGDHFPAPRSLVPQLQALLQDREPRLAYISRQLRQYEVKPVIPTWEESSMTQAEASRGKGNLVFEEGMFQKDPTQDTSG